METFTEIRTSFTLTAIHASYINETGPTPPTRKLGGIAISSADGKVLQQAPFEGEAHIVCEVILENRKGVMTPHVSLVE